MALADTPDENTRPLHHDCLASHCGSTRGLHEVTGDATGEARDAHLHGVVRVFAGVAPELVGPPGVVAAPEVLVRHGKALVKILWARAGVRNGALGGSGVWGARRPTVEAMPRSPFTPYGVRCSTTAYLPVREGRKISVYRCTLGRRTERRVGSNEGRGGLRTEQTTEACIVLPAGPRRLRTRPSQ